MLQIFSVPLLPCGTALADNSGVQFQSFEGRKLGTRHLNTKKHTVVTGNLLSNGSMDLSSYGTI